MARRSFFLPEFRESLTQRKESKWIGKGESEMCERRRQRRGEAAEGIASSVRMQSERRSFRDMDQQRLLRRGSNVARGMVRKSHNAEFQALLSLSRSFKLQNGQLICQLTPADPLIADCRQTDEVDATRLYCPPNQGLSDTSGTRNWKLGLLLF